MAQPKHVVVVGAGVIGCATAYFLSKEGVRVTVLEQESVGSGASVCAMGGLILMSHELAAGPHLDLGVQARDLLYAMYEQVQVDSGVNLLWNSKPHLALAFDGQEEDWLRKRREEVRYAFTSEWLDRTEVLRIEPRINPEVCGGYYTPLSLQLDSYRLTLAYASAVESLGGTYLQRRVTGWRRTSTSVTAVYHAGGEVHCDAVVLCMGPWTKTAAEWLGFETPVIGVKGERLLLRFTGAPLNVHLSSPRYGFLVHQADGLWSVGARGGRAVDDDAEDEAGDAQPTVDAKIEMLGWAESQMPCLADAELVQHLAGIRPVSADGLPLIGQVPGFENVFMATGHGHSGIGLSAVTGRIVADLVVRGTSGIRVDLATFSPARFRA